MEKLEKILQEVHRLKKPEIEKTIFSIGGRGHYENPISDILAFFLDPKEQHGFGSLFLQSIFQAAGKELPSSDRVDAPIREQYTDAGNRLDLIVEGDNWVLVIENKIRHSAINPFADYECFINRQKQYKNKEITFILLSIWEEAAPVNWIPVDYQSLLKHIRNNIGSHFLSANNNKWHVILREFILNIENEYGGTMIDQARINFVKDHYSAFQEASEMLREYTEYFKSQGVAAINRASEKGDVAFAKQHDWGEDGIALRLH